MRKGVFKRRFPALIGLLSLLLLLCGCWGDKEIDDLFIVTGVGLDSSTEPDKMNITFQVAKVEAGSSGDSGSSAADSSTILLESEQGTVTEAIAEFNRNGSRQIFLQHNQVILIGSSLAEKGVTDIIDLFMRDQESRLEVAVLVVDGEAGEALAVETPQKKVSGLFLGKLLEQRSAISLFYRTRLLDFASGLMQKSSAAVVPMVKIVENDGKETFETTGMAVFQDGKLTSSLDNEEVLGFIWFMGNITNSGLTVKDDAGKASLIINQLGTKKTLKKLPDGGFSLKLSVNAVLTGNEIYGFSDMKPLELTNHLMELAQNEIRQGIEKTFQKAQQMQADIYEIGTMVHRKYPQYWHQIEKQWGEHFANIRLEVDVKATLPNNGKVIESLKIEEQSHED